MHSALIKDPIKVSPGALLFQVIDLPGLYALEECEAASL